MMQHRVFKGVVALALVAGAVTLAAEPSIRLLIDDKPASTTVKMIDGRYYVPLDDLAKSLGATTTITVKPDEGTTVALVLPKDAAPAETSGVSGIITYYFNNNFGSKPDTGASVMLVKEDIKIPKTSSLILDVVRAENKERTKLTVVAKGTVDGVGRYELKGVAPGRYTLIITSKHRDDLSLRDIQGQVLCLPVMLKPGETKEFSWDFGLKNVQ